MRLRPVLMPGGWPIEANERETCARAVLASGGDLERVYDESELSLDAYIRYISRVPLFKLAKENPLVFIAGKIESVVSMLAFYTRLFEYTDQFDKASWLTYLPENRVSEFLCDARAWGEVDTWGDELYCWYTSPIPVLVISSASKLSRLRAAVADLERAPASGVVALSEPYGPFPSATPRNIDLPECNAPTHVSFDSLARLRLRTQSVAAEQLAPGRMTTPPPSNPRIRRHTG